MANQFQLSNFMASLAAAGTLPSNRFLVVIQPPKSLANAGYDMRNLTIRCENVNLPLPQLLTKDGINRYGYGVPERIPYSAIFADCSLEFIVDRQATQLKFFYDWVNSIVNLKTDRPIATTDVFEVEYKDNYVCNVTIYVYNELDDKVLECVLDLAYPRNVNDIQLAWQNTNVATPLKIDLSYRNMYLRTLGKTAISSILNDEKLQPKDNIRI